MLGKVRVVLQPEGSTKSMASVQCGSISGSDDAVPSENSVEAVQWSIITVTYNSAQALARSWRDWAAPDGVEWIVVDNASADDSVGVAAALGATVVKSLDRNIGFGAANNAGFRASRGRFVLFANPDLQVQADDLTVLGAYLDEHGGLVAPQLLNDDGSLQPNGRGFPTLPNKVRHRIKSSLLHGYDIFATDYPVPVCFAIGAALAGTRSTVDKLDGWDESFFVYYEDSDICLREWMSGGHVALHSGVRWKHSWARATARFRWEPWRREIASMIRFYARYPVMLGPVSWAKRRHPRVAAAVFGERAQVIGPMGKHD